MNPKQSPERTGGYRNKLAAIAAAGGLALSLAGEIVPDAQAAASAELTTTTETLAAHTGKKMTIVHSRIKTLLKQHNPNVYQQSFMDDGHKAKRIVASYLMPNNRYNQVIDETRAGATKPHTLTVVIGSSEKRYKPSEQVLALGSISKDDSLKNSFLVYSGWLTNTGWQKEQFKAQGNNILAKRGLEQAVPLDSETALQFIDDITTNAAGILEAGPAKGVVA